MRRYRKQRRSTNHERLTSPLSGSRTEPMKSSLKHSGIQKLEDMPEAWRLSVDSELSPQEAVVAWLDLVVARQVHFGSRLVVVT